MAQPHSVWLLTGSIPTWRNELNDEALSSATRHAMSRRWDDEWWTKYLNEPGFLRLHGKQRETILFIHFFIWFQGNNFVKQEKWDEAISCYNRAIELVKDDAIYYANRGLCYLKKDRWVLLEA